MPNADGTPTQYETLLADLDAAQKELGADSISIKQPSPGIEALLRQFGPQISNQLASPICLLYTSPSPRD